ncbi:ATP-binding protein [Aliiglaciecola sp. CAU 1673]|uniref:ATP-binding protein n=1 Tax=Aliiglaciecola sp. CAU 1673 TaxID=3032595 RepID=UPI0023DA896C|nr:ATP-binding protein [Aliiglaciecola sp. CAU 1673]MDF2179508.1 ATP-binding protein [Aliiglaciecola sp. CAU 1673]
MQPYLEALLLEATKSDIIDTGNVAQAEEYILQVLLRGLKVERASLWMLDSDSSCMRCELLIDLHHQTREEDTILTRQQYPRYFEALDTKLIIAAEDAKTNPLTCEFTEGYLNPLHIQSILDAPIRHRGKMVGILCCEQIGKQREWRDEELDFVSSVSELVSRILSAKERDDYARQLEVANQSLEQLVQQRTASLEKTLYTLKKTQEQMVENEKMASLGNLVAGVAHEVNTPLGIAVTATSYCEHVLKELRTKMGKQSLTRSAMERGMEDMSQTLLLIGQNLREAADLIQNFKKTAVDQHNLDLVTFELSDYLRVVMSSLTPLLKSKNVEVELLCSGPVEMHSYPGALAQIMTNLVSNACLHAFAVHRGNCICVQILAEEPGTVLIRCKDNGVGMSEDVRKQVFLPFYTTKRGRGGSGLGLSISYNLVTAKLGGQLTVESKPGAGSLFTLSLPTHIQARTKDLGR